MSDHHCPGLSRCPNHPKWSVLKSDFQGWVALPPGWFPKMVFGPKDLRDRVSHATALNRAQKEARKERA